MEWRCSTNPVAVMPECGPTTTGESLSLMVECRTSRKASRGKRHPVTIGADWSVQTPHDLAAERVAAAFGGYTSCLDLVDHAMPAFRERHQLMARHRLVGLVRASPARWMLADPSAECRCASGTFPTAARAAEHVRSVEHLAARHGARPGQLVALIRAAEEAGVSPGPMPAVGRDDAGLVRESNGLHELWAAGVHPGAVAEMAALVPGCEEPLPLLFYLGVAFCRPDRGWLAQTSAVCPDPDVAAWLAWSQEARHPSSGDTVARWLAIGVPRSAIEVLLAAGISPQTAQALAGIGERTARRTALDLAAWAEAECRPTAEHLMLLDRSGPGPWYRPSGVAIDLICGSTAELEPQPGRTDLGVMLALAGSQLALHVMLGAGARTPMDVVALMNDPRAMEAG